MHIEVDVPYDRGDLAALFHAEGSVVGIVHGEQGTVIEGYLPRRWFEQVWRLVRPGGRLIVSEPAGHVTSEDFSREQAMAEACGFAVEPLGGFRKARAWRWRRWLPTPATSS